jgi:hypothetical protein
MEASTAIDASVVDSGACSLPDSLRGKGSMDSLSAWSVGSGTGAVVANGYQGNAARVCTQSPGSSSAFFLQPASGIPGASGRYRFVVWMRADAGFSAPEIAGWSVRLFESAGGYTTLTSAPTILLGQQFACYQFEVTVPSATATQTLVPYLSFSYNSAGLQCMLIDEMLAYRTDANTAFPDGCGCP